MMRQLKKGEVTLLGFTFILLLLFIFVCLISVSFTRPATDANRYATVGILGSILALGGLIYSAPLVLGRVQDVLGNRNRLSIFNYVSENPGCTLVDISEKQHMNRGTVIYHVLMLESQGKISVRKMGKYIRLFSSRARSELDRTVIAYVKNDTSRSLLYAILEEPGVTNGKLSEKFSLDKSSVHWHMERFLKDHLIRFEQDGRNKRYFLEPGVSQLLTG